MTYFTVSQVAKFIFDVFEAETYLHNICIYGEVSGYKISQNHAYFTLKDENCQIQCSCFNYRKTYVPKDGETVIIKGSPNFYQKGGRLSFVVDFIEPRGKGDLFLKIEELKRKLKEEGLFEEAYKKSIPAYCKTVGVVTSKTGAVIRDINTTIRRYNKAIDIILYDAKVQGVGAVEEMIDGITALDKLNLDAIIIARGGGSVEDLMPFNDERLARTIFSAVTPIISAVGHETDFTICDFVADKRAATPTAAAELVAYSQSEQIENLKYTLGLLNKEITRKLGILNDELYNNIDQINSDILSLFANKTSRCKLVINSLNSAINKKVLLKQNDYIVVDNKLKENGSIINDKTKIRIYDGGKEIYLLTKVGIDDEIILSQNGMQVTTKILGKKVENE